MVKKKQNWAQRLKEKITRHFMKTIRMKEETRAKKKYAIYYKKAGPKKDTLTYAQWLEKERKPTY